MLSIFTLLFCLHATGTPCCQYSPYSSVFTPQEHRAVNIHPTLLSSRHRNTVLSIFTLLFCLHATGTPCCQYSPYSSVFTPQEHCEYSPYSSVFTPHEHCAVTVRGKGVSDGRQPVCPPAELRQKVYEGGADRPSPDKPGTITSLPSVRIPLLAGPDTGRKSATPTPPRPPLLSFVGTNTQKKRQLKQTTKQKQKKTLLKEGVGGGGE